jgi:hypothetical protein
MKKVFLFIIGLFLVGSMLNSCSSTDESNEAGAGLTKRSYPVEYINHIVINPATVSVRFSVKNDGTQSVTPSCLVRMRDASLTYKGWTSAEFTKPILAGQSLQAIVQITIENEGAYYANNFSAECTAYTSDTKLSAGTEVLVSNIEDASWGDDQWELDENKEWPEDAWLGYGPSFKVNQPFGTLMNCTWTAFDKNNNIVGTHTARYNTVNNGVTVPYGQNEQWYIEDTEKVVKSVQTFDVDCKL